MQYMTNETIYVVITVTLSIEKMYVGLLCVDYITVYFLYIE